MADQILADPQASPTNPASTDPNAAAAAPAAQSAQATQQSQQAEVQYNLTAPEGALFDQTHLEQFKQTAKELGLTPEAAQKLVERDNQLLSGFIDRNKQDWQAQTSKWADEVKADKELGGEHFNATVTSARAALDRFATPQFKQMLAESGYGNHPELVRLFAKVGAAMKEDRMVSTGAPPAQKKSMAELFYPDMAKQK
jgi:hypothetical protein